MLTNKKTGVFFAYKTKKQLTAPCFKSLIGPQTFHARVTRMTSERILGRQAILKRNSSFVLDQGYSGENYGKYNLSLQCSFYKSRLRIRCMHISGN